MTAQHAAPPGRRAACLVAAAALGLTALAGCRSAPDVAAYVGRDRITTDAVDAIIDDWEAAVGQKLTQERPLGARYAVHWLVFAQTVERWAPANKITIKPLPADQLADEQGNVPPKTRLFGIYSRFRAAYDAVFQAATPVPPTEEQKRLAYRNATLQNQPVSEPYAEVAHFFNQETMGRALGMRRLVEAAFASQDVEVNPRFGTDFAVEYGVRGARTFYTVPFGRSVPVADAPADAPRRTPGAGGDDHSDH